MSAAATRQHQAARVSRTRVHQRGARTDWSELGVQRCLSPETFEMASGTVGVPEYWIVDLDARLIERWTPADERPEILRERLAWTDPVSGAEKSTALTCFMAP
jgi:hypothetical protein